MWRATDYYDKDFYDRTYYIHNCERLFCATKTLGNTKVHVLITRIHANGYRDYGALHTEFYTAITTYTRQARTA